MIFIQFYVKYNFILILLEEILSRKPNRRSIYMTFNTIHYDFRFFDFLSEILNTLDRYNKTVNLIRFYIRTFFFLRNFIEPKFCIFIR